MNFIDEKWLQGEKNTRCKQLNPKGLRQVS